MKLTKLILTALLAATLLLAAGCRAADEDAPEPQPEQTVEPEPAPAELQPPPVPLEVDDLFQEFNAYEGPELIVYHISDSTFKAFIETADPEIMQDAMYAVIFHPPIRDELVVRWVLETEFGAGLIRDEALAFVITDMIADKEFVEAYSTAQGIENILAANGVNAQVEEFFMFFHWLFDENEIPLTIAVYTDADVHFIAVRPSDGGSEYTVYTHAEYFEKYREHSGSLFINNVLVADTEGALFFEGRSVLAPLRLILEELGCEVQIEEDEVFLGRVGTGEMTAHVVYFSFERHGRGYTLAIVEGMPSLKDNESGEYIEDAFILTAGSFTFAPFETIEDFETLVNEETLQNIINRIGASAIVNYETQELRIFG